MSALRAFLLLSRASLLPTVWSNCLAGWWLGGGGNEGKLAFLFAGATCLYIGGAFLNDAFDAEFDYQFRRTRPIPAGAVSASAVWSWGLFWLVLGMASLMWAGRLTGTLGVALGFYLLLFNLTHRFITFAPLLLGVCRFFLYAIGASVAMDGISGWALWCGIAVSLYVGGAGFSMRRQNPAAPLRYWPLLLLFCPILLAVVMNTKEFREPGLLLSLVLGLWIIRCARQSLWSLTPNAAATTAGLHAGIVFVDWLACADAPRYLGFIYIGLFLLALTFQNLGERAAAEKP